MKKLIDADKLIHDLPEQIDITKRMLDKIIKVIDNQEPVRKEGRWIPSGTEGF